MHTRTREEARRRRSFNELWLGGQGDVSLVIDKIDDNNDGFVDATELRHALVGWGRHFQV